MSVGERRTDDNGVWAKLTIPVLLAVALHAGTIIWWARGVQEEIDKASIKYELLKESISEQIGAIASIVGETRVDVKANEKQILRCLLQNERSHGKS
jgi:hypothetical protein